MSQKKVNATENTNQTGDVNGVFNREKNEDVPNFSSTSAERIIDKGNAWIVLGRDRPIGSTSGYGGSGDSRAAAIDICVGRQGTNPRRDDFVENNFGTLSYNRKAGDAARIYISQRANIDEYFGLKEGSQGLSKAKAAIGMMADDIRLVARRGIKLVTGGPKQVDALGQDTNSILGIDLMAGNISYADKQGKEYLQPLVKGQNLLEALEGIVEEILNLNSAMTSFTMRQMVINSNLIGGTYVGTIPFAPVVPITSQLNPASVTLAAVENAQIVSDVIVPLQTQRNLVLNSLKLNYLQSSGTDYICSRYNRTN